MARPDSSATRKARMREMLEEINPLQRMIVSPGLDRAFEKLRALYPGFTVHEYPSGLTCEDWEVPESWEILSGALADEQGNVLASAEECPLFAAPYSEPVDGWFTKSEIEPHLMTRPDRPAAYCLNHRHAYNYRLLDWGITLPFERWRAMSDKGGYHVRIETRVRPGVMRVGEYFRAGASPETICVCAHIDELCNDDLAGCCVAAELTRSIAALENPRYSYQVLLVPEMFGALFYVYNNLDRVRSTIMMLNLETTGAGETWCLKKARIEDSLPERVLRNALAELDLKYDEYGFFQALGNDERVYAWPTLNIPGVSLQRYPFKQYHTSEDTPEIISDDLQYEALRVCESFIGILEKDYVPRFVNILQPWLTKHDLYRDVLLDPDNFMKFNNLVLFNLDGKNSVLDLAAISGIPFSQVHDYLEQFIEKGLVRRDDD